MLRLMSSFVTIRCRVPLVSALLAPKVSDKHLQGKIVCLTRFKVVPSSHRDLAAVKLALILETRLLRGLARGLSCVAPTEVVKLPKRVRGKHEIPDGER